MSGSDFRDKDISANAMFARVRARSRGHPKTDTTKTDTKNYAKPRPAQAAAGTDEKPRPTQAAAGAQEKPRPAQARPATDVPPRPAQAGPITFGRLKWVSFTHSCIYTSLLVCAFALGKPEPATDVLGWSHGLLWIGMSLTCIMATRLRIVPLRLAVAVAVLGGIGPFFGSYEFVREQRRRTVATTNPATAPVPVNPAQPANSAASARERPQARQMS